LIYGKTRIKLLFYEGGFSLRFNCECGHGLLLETENKFSTEGIIYPVYICEECKRYYARQFNHLIGVDFDNIAQTWKQNNLFLPNVW